MGPHRSRTLEERPEGRRSVRSGEPARSRNRGRLGNADSGKRKARGGAKSPLTGGFGEADVGGFWGAELKRAGFDAVIVTGASETPAYLWIKDAEVEIRDASDLRGKRTAEVGAVMGPKRLRAVAVRGSSEVKAADETWSVCDPWD